MTVYPDARYRPLGPQTQPRLVAHDIVCLHTMVGSLDGTDTYFRSGDGYGGTESHFGIGYDGTVVQWQDLDFTADANLAGNGRIISIETADTGPGFPPWSGSDVPAWLPAQLDALANLIAWLCSRYNIPCAAVPDSLPSRRGVGWHRLGVDPWRVPGGERWSSSLGKVCPGDRRIAQMPALISKANNLMTVPIPPGVFMALTDAEQTELLKRVRALEALKPGVRLPGRSPGLANSVDDHFGWSMTAAGRADTAAAEVAALRADVAQLRDIVARLGDPAAFAQAVAVNLSARLKD